MKKYNLNLYKLIVLVFVTIIFLLCEENYKLFSSIKSINVSSHTFSYSSIHKKYGYSDILSILLKDSNITIKNIGSALEDENIANIEIEYSGDINSFYNILQDFQNLDNFCYADNVKIVIDYSNKQNISSKLYFIKNK
ncbi:hypothetical protein M2651_08335 [Clostridium sp. SYSU_GA19001]|uniref:hypothetical protein n=1 Tax=Clostridium caldaquaticum TaxID=2940653 RepID=UPI002077988E|nr:hypothetical protein [Clostridium caldaquaticum]MCM8711033.1 hypothetical protein [Clostridium caldaquaticum]